MAGSVKENCRWWDCSMDGRDEWAPEGKLKAVGEPERILRYQISAYGSMHERMQMHQAGWHRRRS